MASDVECITLDDSDEDQGVAVAPVPRVQGQGAIRRLAPVPALAAGPLVREEQMMRCNLCVDPGLLPVEEDRAAHRYSPNDLVLMLIFLTLLNIPGGKSTPTNFSTAMFARGEKKVTKASKNSQTS